MQDAGLTSGEERHKASLCVDAQVLDPDHTLSSGQAFRWAQMESDDWIGVVSPAGATVCVGRRGPNTVIDAAGDPAALQNAVRYFRIDDNVERELSHWSNNHGSEIASAIVRFRGLRVLRQDPLECLVSFMTSAAAPIYRIRRCMDNLCRTYGERCHSPFATVDIRLFPTAERLAQLTREEFDRLGFGFRGGNIRLAARQIMDAGGEGWIRDLRRASYADAKRELMTLRGIGEKIADCVCLFSLDKDEAVPIDVHMARIARRLFGESVGTPASKDGYARIANAYRDRFGSRAGWAQQYLYYAEIVGNGLWDEALGRHRPGGEAGGTRTRT